MLSAPVRQRIVQARTRLAMRQFDMLGQNVTVCPLSTLTGYFRVAQRPCAKFLLMAIGVRFEADFRQPASQFERISTGQNVARVTTGGKTGPSEEGLTLVQNFSG